MRLFKSVLLFSVLSSLMAGKSLLAYDLIEANKGELLFQDDFSRPEFGQAWRSHADSFFIENGVMRATQLPDAGHGAVIRALVDFEDVWIRFDFKYEGGERFNFVIDDKNEKSVHAGHICRLTMNKRRVTVQDDKTGVMDLVIRKQRLSGNATPELEKLLKTKQVTVDTNFEEGRWYRMDVLIRDDQMQVHLDGEFLVGHKSPGFAHPTKTQFGFTVTGQSLFYDNVRVWALK